MKALSRLADNDKFSRYWKDMGRHLGLTGAEIEQCEGKAGSDVNEACMEMLKTAAQRKDRVCLTVAILSEAVHRTGYYFLYDPLRTVVS